MGPHFLRKTDLRKAA